MIQRQSDLIFRTRTRSSRATKTGALYNKPNNSALTMQRHLSDILTEDLRKSMMNE